MDKRLRKLIFPYNGYHACYRSDFKKPSMLPLGRWLPARHLNILVTRKVGLPRELQLLWTRVASFFNRHTNDNEHNKWIYLCSKNTGLAGCKIAFRGDSQIVLIAVLWPME